MLEKLLEKLGLSEKEAKVYLAILELGQDTVQNIARKAKITRPTAYVILESLAKKGLVTSVEHNKKTLFAAESPEQLKLLIKKQQDDLKDKEDQLKESFPEFKALFNLTENKPKVKFYEGKEGITAMHEEFLRLPGIKDIVGFTPIDDLFRVFPDYEEAYTPRRAQKNVRSRVIYTTVRGQIPGATSSNLQREARFVPKDRFPFSSGMNAYGDKHLVMVSYGENLMGVAIESPEITQTFRTFFELAWEAAEKYQ